MIRLFYRPAALSDLDAIYDAIEPDSPRRALNFVNEIRERCRGLCEHPKLGPARDDLAAGIRIYPMRGRVVVAYRAGAEAVQIVRVFYGGQDFEAILRGDVDLDG
jgi:toxin ParE1/3/4